MSSEVDQMDALDRLTAWLARNALRELLAATPDERELAVQFSVMRGTLLAREGQEILAGLAAADAGQPIPLKLRVRIARAGVAIGNHRAGTTIGPPGTPAG